MKNRPLSIRNQSRNAHPHRSRWRARSTGALLFAAFMAPFAGGVSAASYAFTNIADSNGIFAPTEPTSGIGNGFLSINNFGMVAFGSGLDDGGNGVFRGNGGPITSIALSSGPVFSGVVGGSINDAGTVAFSGSLDAGGQGVFTWNAGTTTTVVTTSDGFTSVGSLGINNAGRVLFSANVGGGSTGIFLRGGGLPQATVAVTSGPIFSAISGTTINASGTVGFSGFLDSGSSGVFTGNGGPVTTIALTPYPGGMTPSINNVGTVVFSAGSDAFAASSIMLGNGGPVTTFVSNSGPFSAFGNYPVINNNGKVVFLGGLDDGRVGLFTGPDPVVDKVILNNEPLFGSIVTSFTPGNIEHLSPADINDSGQIAFHYQLADGRQGIAVATPVPEAQTAVALVMGAAVLGLDGWKRRGRKSQNQFK